ncbi:MAG: hypothetical protein N3H31_04060 [Candidatus Nezhaarchaeota archaeon]|nr:hypothetical protein [Candidatus Nezhaarchaeota archaeon]
MMEAGTFIYNLYFITYGVLPYFTVAIVALSFMYKLTYWLRGSASKMPLLKAPSLSQAGFNVLAGLVLDLLLFRRVYRASFKLWCATWTMHLCAPLVLIGHLFFLTGPLHEVPTAALMTSLQEYVRKLSPYAIPAPLCKSALFIVGLVLVGALAALLVARLRSPLLRSISSPASYSNLVLLIVTSLLGLSMSADSLFIRRLTIQEVTLLSSLHGISAQLLFASIPFTLLHIFPGAEVTKLAYELRRLVRR